MKKRNDYVSFLIYNDLINIIINTLFYQYDLMFVKKYNIQKSYPHVTKLTTIDQFEDKLTVCFKLDEFSNLYLSLETNGDIIECGKNVFSLSGKKPEEVNNFINFSISHIISYYIEPRLGIKSEYPRYIKPNIISSDVGFMKKISDIREEGEMYKYIIMFEDNTHHTVLTDSKIKSNIKRGDYGFLDELNSFNFVSKESIN